MERDQGQLRAAQRPGEPGGDATQAEERSEELRCKIVNESMPQPLKKKQKNEQNLQAGLRLFLLIQSLENKSLFSAVI